jgi:hypothetical protein
MKTSPKSIESAKRNAKRFWTEPELIAKNIAGRASERFQSTHTAAHLCTEEMREKCRIARLKSEKYKISQKQKGFALQSEEIRKRKIEAIRNSPLVAAATKRMREALSRSEKCQPGIKNHAARKWHIRSPSNVSYHFVNLMEFIRRNPQLFDPDDIPVRANRGIGLLRPTHTKKRVHGTWKGWTWISSTEAFHNGGEDLVKRTQNV